MQRPTFPHHPSNLELQPSACSRAAQPSLLLASLLQTQEGPLQRPRLSHLQPQGLRGPWLQDRGGSGPPHRVRPSSHMGQHSQVPAQATSQSMQCPWCVLRAAARGALRCSPSCSDPPRLLAPRGKEAKSFPDLRGWSPVTRPTNTPGSSHTGLLVFQDVLSMCPDLLTPSQLHTAAPSCPVGLLQGHPGVSSNHLSNDTSSDPSCSAPMPAWALYGTLDIS